MSFVAYQEPGYTQYSHTGFTDTTGHQTTNALSVSTNSSYVYSQPSVLSVTPSSGTYGTRVVLKISSQQDILGPQTYLYVFFGSRRCETQIQRDGQDQTGHFYNIFVEVPQFIETGSQEARVQMTVVIEWTNSTMEPTRVVAGVFYYHDGPNSGGQVGVPAENVTSTRGGKPSDSHSPSQQLRQDIAAPDHCSASTTYNHSGCPPTSAQQEHQSASAYTATGYNATNAPPPTSSNSMIGAYRSTGSFNDPLVRGSSLRSPSWNPYSVDASRNSPASLGAAAAAVVATAPSASMLPRPSQLTPLPGPPTNASCTPMLVRTSTIQNVASSPSASSYSPYTLYPNKAQLKIQGDLDMMADGWTPEEVENRRRIVLFKKNQSGSTLSVNFRPVSINDRPSQSILVSCIWWAEKGECYVTSVDTIHLLEQLLAAPSRFTVEEKNRIRRNLEGFHPLTVSKAKAESEEFFKIIMAFPNPKPRNIEKDVKVFPWKVLGQALKKIISKYSASPSSTMPPAAPHAMLPVSLGPGYPSLPPTPTDPMPPHPSYSASAPPTQHDLQTPRSVSGSSQPWSAAQYGAGSAAARTLSPPAPLRIPLSHGYDTRPPPVTTTQPYSMPSIAPRWDTNGYPTPGDSAAPPTYAAHAVTAPSAHATSQVYGATYGDGTHRA